MKRLFLDKRLGLILLLLDILTILYFFQPLLLVASNPEYILFVEKNCEFCSITTRQINQKEYQERLPITTMDISESKFYENIYHSITSKCSISLDQKGVPLLYSQGKCYVGAKSTLQELERLSIYN